MKQSLRLRLVFLSAGMIILSIVICWIMNLFLLPGYYEYFKKKTMDSAYGQTAELFAANDWESLSVEQKTELYDEVDKISLNSSVTMYIMEVRVNVESGMVNSIDYLYPGMSDQMKEKNIAQFSKYVMFKRLGNVFDENYEMIQKTKSYELYKVYDERTSSSYMELVGGLNGNRYTKPILALAKLAQKMEQLNFDVRYEEDRKDEIGVLGHSMNSLSDKLEETISELKTANNELQLDLQRRSEQEQMRQEFLANVSHELKTPIALIQGYAEGLQENVNEDAESREFYCEVIVDEADKMNQMVKRLLSLNQLEFGNGQVHLEHFDVREVVKSVLASSDILFRQKGITVSFAETDPVFVWADEYMAEEVVMNYVSNAVNHIGGERIIEVKIQSSGEKARISVFNTGEKIPEGEIGKIWNKFYKVDKARTREYGGNGIGLSIVKAIMDAHNQQYGVKNYEN